MTVLTYVQGGPRPEGGVGWRRSWSRPFGDSRSEIRILNGHARGGWLCDPEGTFSIKWVPKGRAVYRVGGASHALAGDHMVILNAAQPYELEFPNANGTQTLCVFYSDDLLAAAWQAAARPDTADDPTAMPERLPEFPDIAFRPGGFIGRELARLHAAFASDDPSVETSEEQLLALLETVIASAGDHAKAAARIGAVKPATRRLLLARLERAREMIDDMPDHAVSLDELARAAALSKFHLLRLFKAVHGTTPQAYAQRRRIERAQILLRTGTLPGAAIATAAGYESESAFIRAFRKQCGVTPGAWRAQAN